MQNKINLTYCLVGLDGGVGNLILNYVDHMNTSDYNIKIVAQDTSSILYKKLFENRGIKICKIPSKKESIIKNYKALKKELKGSDIVHAHMTLTNCFPLYVAWKLGIKNRISHSHLNEQSTIKSKILSLLTKLFATHYWACGKDAGKYLYGKSKFMVLNNAIDLTSYEYNNKIREEERKKLSVSESTYVVGHVGRFTKQKNHRFVIELFNELSKNFPNCVLVLIGEGENKSQIENLVQNLGLEKKVYFLGSINDVEKKLQAMDIFLLPSLYEGLPVSLIEAEANGLPCLISDKVTQEVIINNNVVDLSLKEKKEVWVKNILYLLKKGRVKTQNEISKKGYDICKEAKKLDCLYHDMVI